MWGKINTVKYPEFATTKTPVFLKCLPKYNLWRYSRKCLRKFNFNDIRSPELSAYHLPQPKEFFPSKMFEIFSSVLAYRRKAASDQVQYRKEHTVIDHSERHNF
jgi:hypothetical protein